MEVNGLKVCFLAGTLGRGGAERQLVYMLRALKPLGVSTRVISLTQGESFEDEIRSLGVPLECIGSSSSRLVRLARLISALRRERPHILQSAHFYTNLYAALAGRITGISNIGAIRNDLNSEIAANGWLGKWQLSLPQHLIANSELAMQRALGRGISPARIDFVRNVVETKQLKETVCSGECKTTTVSFVGRLVPQKRPDLFLRVVSKVIHLVPGQNLKIIIAGDGPMRPQLEALATELGLGSEQLMFLGAQRDMDRIYRKTDLLVMTSDHEGTPNVLLEAMAHGIPVVATKVGGVSAILDESRGLIVEPNNEQGQIAAILKLLGNQDLRTKLGQQGREYVNEIHSIDILQRQLIGIYEKVLAQ